MGTGPIIHDDVEIVLRKKQHKPKTEAEKRAAIAAAQRNGSGVETVSKFSGGGNRQHGTDLNTRKLDEAEDAQPLKKVPMSVGKTISKARTAAGLNQKELAQKINEKPSVIISYEQGKAIPNQAVLTKLQRILKVKLQGKNIGDPLPGRGKKK